MHCRIITFRRLIIGGRPHYYSTAQTAVSRYAHVYMPALQRAELSGHSQVRPLGTARRRGQQPVTAGHQPRHTGAAAARVSAGRRRLHAQSQC